MKKKLSEKQADAIEAQFNFGLMPRWLSCILHDCLDSMLTFAVAVDINHLGSRDVDSQEFADDFFTELILRCMWQVKPETTAEFFASVIGDEDQSERNDALIKALEAFCGHGLGPYGCCCIDGPADAVVKPAA
jgi:hypothetical protein